ncbi:MAG: hypothetical protein ACUVTM_00375 [Candidatus Bathyarchaeia archaeon]
MSRYHRGRRHEEKVMNRYKKYPRIRSARSLKVDVIIFSENGVTKLVECKRCSQDSIYIYPRDLHNLHHYYERLTQLGHKPQMILSLWFPKRRVTREVTLDPASLARMEPLKFELRDGRLLRCTTKIKVQSATVK